MIGGRMTEWPELPMTRVLAAGVLAAMLGLGAAVAPARAQSFDGDGGGPRYGYGDGPGWAAQDYGRGDVDSPRWGRGPGYDRPLDWNRGPRWRDDVLSPRAIEASLYRRGYRDVDIRGRRGPNYVAEARGRRGRVLIVVDARSAEITGLKVLDWDRPRRLYDEGGWMGPSPWSGPRW
jgi:hypothetical protein